MLEAKGLAMLFVLYWLGLGLTCFGFAAIAASLVSRRDDFAGIGVLSLSAGIAMFGFWTTLTLSGFMGIVCFFLAATLVIMLVKSTRSMDAGKIADLPDALPHSQDTGT